MALFLSDLDIFSSVERSIRLLPESLYMEYFKGQYNVSCSEWLPCQSGNEHPEAGIL